MYTLSVPPYSYHWPEDGFVKTETCSQEPDELWLCSDGINHSIAQ